MTSPTDTHEAAELQPFPDGFSSLLDRLQRGASAAELLNLGAEDLDPIYAAGYHLYGQGRFDEALKVFGTLATLAPLQVKFQHALATCLQRQGRYREAAQRYTCLALIEPENSEALFRLAECLLAEGERKSAVGVLETLVRDCDDSQASWRVRAVALLKLQNHPSSPLPGESE